ncbi:MAG TPA: aminotransferase class V-fold PLP-dependent enzyme [Vicinamibacterales bacterium]|nr:aminotransferase class V-fold PLP-dependent enzyme [Vicinamibacterales bacterium]
MSVQLTAEERDALGRAALDWVLRYFSEQADLPVYPTIGASELTARLSGPLPADPQAPAHVLADFDEVARYGRHNGHPRMFGYVQSSGGFAGVIGDLLASAINQNVTSWRSAPAATTIELQVVEWLKTMVGFDAGGAGILLSGGSFANFAGLATALRASTDIDLNQRGVAALPGRPRIYASAMTHMSMPKAASMLGLGKDAIVPIPVDDQFRMRPDALGEQIAADRAAGFHPVCAVATAGDVNTGAIDPLDAIADVCEASGLWMHVDGSYGALAARSPHVSGAMDALRRADSLSLDPHKWLYAPLDVGCLLVRNVASLRRAFSEGAGYIDVVADREMSDFAYWDHSPELSRRFRALKIWFLLKIHGSRAIQAAIDDNIAVARHLARLLDDSGDFERVAPVPLSIVCFRSRQGDDAFNRALMVELQRDGESYLSNAVINGRFALRACIVNFRTRPADVERLLDSMRRVASR